MSSIFCSQGHSSPEGSLFCQVCGEKLSPPQKLMLSVGEVLEGRYRIVQQIGQGGFGRTYLCENLNRFNEPCVLKEFAPQVQGSYALGKAKTLFEREANVLHQLTHPQIPRFRELFQLNSGGGGLFLVQDYVAGPTYRHLLAQRMVQNQLFSETEIRQFLLDTLPVLEYTHSLGVIHRDISPDNLILRSSDHLPVLIDFGGVKQLAVNAEIQAIGATDLPTCLGKIGYAPHEQIQRGQTYPHSDLYALAATALVLATGKEPTELIEPQNLHWNWRQHVTLDPKFGEILDRMLHPNISARFQSATEVLVALKSVEMPGMPPAKTPLKNSNIGTVVVSPGGHPNSPRKQRGPVTAPPSTEGELWPILKRSWLALAAMALLGGGAWGAHNMLSKTTTNSPTPTASPTVVESPASATPAASSPSPSSDQSSDRTPQPSAASRSSDAPVAPPDSAGSVPRNRAETNTRSGNDDAQPESSSRRSNKAGSAANSSRTKPTEAPPPPKTPTAAPAEIDSTDEDFSGGGFSVDTPSTPQRSRGSSARPPSATTPLEPASPARRARESSAPRRSRESSVEPSTRVRIRESSASRRSSEGSGDSTPARRTASEANDNRPRSSSSSKPRNSSNGNGSGSEPAEKPLF